MELADFAKSILLSPSLSEKLFRPGVLTDRKPLHALNLPMGPARSEKLSLSRWKTSAKVSFPSKSELLNPTQVGVLLHFFANHELLALELMALALLKFPDAPAAFRLGIAHTMQDEQKHLLSYIKRMTELGVEFGDIALNDFFWSQCASMQTPMDFVCRMSLTFEQANLDFAAYFRDVLLEIEDRTTAATLDEVLRDEINHVRHGLNWFRRWKPQNTSDWKAFCAALGTEINPSRAKGTIFRADYRRQTGLGEEFIESLLVYNQSKGRPPRVVFYNPEAEEEIRLGGDASPALSQILIEARRDLSPIMVFLSAQSDVVLLGRELPKEFLLSLRKAGFLLPELHMMVGSEGHSLGELRGRKLGGVLPWSVSPSSMRLEKSLRLSENSSFKGTRENLRMIYSKAFALQLLREFLQENEQDSRLVDVNQIGREVRSPAEFDEFISACGIPDSQQKFVAKRPWSASGRHRVFGEISLGSWNRQPEQIRKWFEKSWRTNEVPIVQIYFSRVLDVSIQARIDGDGSGHKTHISGVTRVLNTPRGRYAGSCVGRYLSEAEPRLVRFFHQSSPCNARNSEGLEQLMEELSKWVGGRLYQHGFTGPFGIDAFIFTQSDGTLKFFPMIEINPRHTMGRVAVSLARRMVPGRVGVWLHVPKSWLEKLQVDSFSELRERWRALLPLQTYERSGGVVLTEGMLETTPAEMCQQVWTCFIVARHLNDELEKLGLRELLSVSGTAPRVGMPEMLP